MNTSDVPLYQLILMDSGGFLVNMSRGLGIYVYTFVNSASGVVSRH